MISKKQALVKGVCPISHGSCKFCSLYRGRHYYAFTACQEYLHRLHRSTVVGKSLKLKKM